LQLLINNCRRLVFFNINNVWVSEYHKILKLDKHHSKVYSTERRGREGTHMAHHGGELGPIQDILF